MELLGTVIKVIIVALLKTERKIVLKPLESNYPPFIRNYGAQKVPGVEIKTKVGESIPVCTNLV